MKATPLDYAILGILSQAPQTGYGIRKIFETTALGNFSSSPGSIYPALNRLQKIDLVEKQTVDSKKSNFVLTEKGKKMLKEWLASSLDIQDIKKDKDALMLRFAFMNDILSESEILHFLNNLENLLKKYIEELTNYHNLEQHNMPLTGRLAFEYGIESYHTILKWCIASKKKFPTKH